MSADFAFQIGETLMEGRALAESLMLDTCKVTRIALDDDGNPALTTDERGVVTEACETVYEGKAKRQTYEGHEQNLTSGAHTVVVQRYSAHFPVGAFIPAVGDRIEWLTAAYDPDLPGTVDRITSLFNKSMATAQRVFVDEVVA